MRLFYIFLGFCFLISSCKKDELEGTASVLVGKWKWAFSEVKANIESCPTCPPEIQTPDANTSYEIEFQEKGKFQFYKNGEEQFCKRMIFDGVADFPVLTNGKYFQYELRPGKERFRIVANQDTLYLFDLKYPSFSGCVSGDCEARTYYVRN